MLRASAGSLSRRDRELIRCPGVTPERRRLTEVNFTGLEHGPLPPSKARYPGSVNRKIVPADREHAGQTSMHVANAKQRRENRKDVMVSSASSGYRPCSRPLV